MVRSFEPVAGLLARLWPRACVFIRTHVHYIRIISIPTTTPQYIYAPDGYLIVSVTQHFCLPTSQLDYVCKLEEDLTPDNEGYAFYIYVTYIKKDLAYVAKTEGGCRDNHVI